MFQYFVFMLALIAAGLPRHIQPVFNCGGTAADAADRRCCKHQLISLPVAVQVQPVHLMPEQLMQLMLVQLMLLN